ncbi:hypothetical protein Ciccas_011496 [Cichlidogyrus casuarinus]|uniref:RNA polymerase II elongation factor ELL N-terminal domain-containing protein n=1 Tax=Cichlidogyrus casuarinus TaxID=1844966 RepID=A0ABD2PVW0_9PLAT
MARERMVQAENEQRNNHAKTLTGSMKEKKASVVGPRNCSTPAKGPFEPKVQSATAESISPKQMREMVINLLALRAHGLVELHQKLKCRSDSSAKKELNTLLKEVSSCGSDGSFQLLPKFYQEVNLNWSGFTSIDKIKVEHLKHEPMASPLPLSQKFAILDDLKNNFLSRAQILRKHSISAAIIDQLLAQEDQLREAQRRQQKSSDSMRISTAPRLPSAATTRSSHFHLPSSGSNSAPVSAEGSQPPASRRIDATSLSAPMPKEYPVVASAHSQKSSSGCSSMASSILSSPSNHQGLSAYVSADKKPKLPPAPIA